MCIRDRYMGITEISRKMVLIHFKKSDNNQFLYETTVSIPVDQLIGELVEVNNLRLSLDKIVVAIEELVTQGPLKPEELRGLTTEETIQAAAETLPPEKRVYANPPVLSPGQRLVSDKTGYRTGVIPSEELTNMVLSEVSKAKSILSKDSIARKYKTTAKDIKEAIDLLRGAIMIVYPGYFGLPDWEPVPKLLENKFDLASFSNENIDWHDPKTATLWFASKELSRNKLLSDYVGKNEKVTIVVKLQASGAGAPVREPAVDQEAYKNMLAFYYKKQEESKVNFNSSNLTG
eukprot:TRINITY_DN9143_c0_g1_i1.p1 TRINITY_DN9143_c0_g1~~TRINITY_DN9143_c0_g1_i1.p1  ORF type:complete len:306 (-),score=58.42 TRINITY_DN9143_c0_g1_i1:22-891(-)